MQVTMLYTRRGSEDGYTVKLFIEGETYEMSDLLARRFIRERQAYAAGGEPPASPVPGPFAFRFPEAV